mmetsp:Transcript_36141/g.90917  ORF Transcript_36141/g.90917 Transcript_36141/m.90917 type:complete len:128 (+) Transcript_36141:341-724(+)
MDTFPAKLDPRSARPGSVFSVPIPAGYPNAGRPVQFAVPADAQPHSDGFIVLQFLFPLWLWQALFRLESISYPGPRCRSRSRWSRLQCLHYRFPFPQQYWGNSGFRSRSLCSPINSSTICLSNQPPS